MDIGLTQLNVANARSCLNAGTYGTTGGSGLGQPIAAAVAEPNRPVEAFGGKGFFVEDPKDLKGALDEAMNFRGPALVNVVISQGAARKPQAFRWHS
jgi:thiamine pyrophosphate-dependent acetolactate synthase large subunit-like protein